MRLRGSIGLALRGSAIGPCSRLLLQGTVWGVAGLSSPAVIGGTRRAALERASEIGTDGVRSRATRPPPSTALSPATRRGLRSASREPAPLRAIAASPSNPGNVGVLRAPAEAPVARGLSLAEGRLLDAAREPGAEVVLEARLASRLEARVGSRVRLGDGGEATVVGVLAGRSALQRRTSDVGYDVEHPMFVAVTGGLLSALGVPQVADEWKRTDACAYLLPEDDRVDWIYVRTAATDSRRVARIGQDALGARGKDAVALYPFLPVLLTGEVDRFAAVSVASPLLPLMGGRVASLGSSPPSAAPRRSRSTARGRLAATSRSSSSSRAACSRRRRAPRRPAGAPPRDAPRVARADGRVHVAFPWREAWIAFAVAVVVGTLASLVPALRAASADPVEGLADE